MPTATRSAWSFIALVLVVALATAGAAAPALGRQAAPRLDVAPVATTSTTVRPDADGSNGFGTARKIAARFVDDERSPKLHSGTIPARPPADRTAGSAQRSAWISRAVAPVPEARPKSMSRAEAASASGSFRGRNHVWIPALGVDRAVSFFSCSSSAYPGDRVYRWGCAGGNNVYLFGHAHSVFRALHDAYVRGRLSKGMKVHYANADGNVSTYAVSWWKVTTPDKGAWAYAAQSRPSLTLQTCVGAQSQYRLIVRLTQVG